MTEELEPERIFARALRPVAAALEASPVSIHLIDGATGALRLEAQSDHGGVSDRSGLPRDRGLTGSVLQSGCMIAADRPDTDPRYDADVDTPADGVTRPLIAVQGARGGARHPISRRRRGGARRRDALGCPVRGDPERPLVP